MGKVKTSVAVFMMSFALMACTEGANKVTAKEEGKTEVKITPLAKAEQDKIKKAFADKSNGQVKPEDILSISSTPLAGVYEIVISKENIFYIDKEANYALVGNFIDIKNQKNLTEQTAEALSVIDYKALPFEKAIKSVQGKGTLQVAVFSDPDCPYCKKLESNFEKIDDITIYTFLMPIESLHPEAIEKSKKIWCSKDKAAAWNNWMRKGTEPTGPSDCANPIDDIQKLGRSHAFNGTPVMVLPNGKTIVGYIENTDELKKMISDGQENVKK